MFFFPKNFLNRTKQEANQPTFTLLGGSELSGRKITCRVVKDEERCSDWDWSVVESVELVEAGWLLVGSQLSSCRFCFQVMMFSEHNN